MDATLDVDSSFDGATFESLGEAVKTNGAAPKLPVAETYTINNRRMDYVADIALIAALGPTSATDGTVADRFVALGNPGTFDALKLDPYAGPATTGTDAFDVNAFTLAASRLTTLSPLVDGRDNDGNGTTDDDNEVFVPGRLNLNTAPLDVLAGALPIPSDMAADRENLAQAIMNARTAAGNPGIRYVMELADQAAIRDVAADTNDTMFWNAGAQPNLDLGAPVPANAMPVDWSNWATLDANENLIKLVSDNIAADASRDERLLLARWLTQVGTTRSDMFAAYIYVRGYTVGAFDQPAVDQIRAIAIFSRANVRNAGGQAQLLSLTIVE